MQEAQMANPDVPLGTAEQFLLSLASISALIPRLQLWAFKLNYEALEKVRLSLSHKHTDTKMFVCLFVCDELKFMSLSLHCIVANALLIGLSWEGLDIVHPAGNRGAAL